MGINVGIVGLGFMGKMHFGTYASIPGAKVVAICDVDKKKREGDWSAIGGNIATKGEKTDLSGIAVYAELDEMLADPKIDMVDITLPTYLHADAAVKAFKAGKHVVSEKPMAIDAKAGKRMVEAAKKAKKQFFIAHCIRFWPAYAKAKEIIKSGKYGKVISAVFRRVSLLPTWSWENWLQDDAKSGLCPLDLHIHDADFILHTFGKPKSVQSVGAGMEKNRVDHIVTSYEYKKDQMVVAEGGWEFAPDFGFEMSFNIAMEKATMQMKPDTSLHIFPKKGKAKEVKLSPKDGYALELAHFVKCVKTGKKSDVVTPASALDSVRLIAAERKSAATGRRVAFK